MAEVEAGARDEGKAEVHPLSEKVVCMILGYLLTAAEVDALVK